MAATKGDDLNTMEQLMPRKEGHTWAAQQDFCCLLISCLSCARAAQSLCNVHWFKGTFGIKEEGEELG